MGRYHDITFPDETDEYRHARDELLAAELELRRQTEHVAELRRELPTGGVVDDYAFTGDDGRVRLSELFEAGRDTLAAYSFMYGPNMESPCPLCTSVIDGLNGNALDIERRVNLVVIAKSPYERVREFADRRGWNDLRILSSHGTTYNADYHGETPDGAQLPMMNVFVREDEEVRHFWASEMLFADDEGGQDARHVDAFWPLWNVLDLTPEGRDEFYPGLDYK